MKVVRTAKNSSRIYVGLPTEAAKDGSIVKHGIAMPVIVSARFEGGQTGPETSR